jgi:hypothetical protein
MEFKSGGPMTQFIGTEGTVTINGKLVTDPPSLAQAVIGPNGIHLVQSRDHGRNLAESIRTRKDPVANIEDAVHSDIISHVCDIAIRLQRKLTWDPVKEQFLGDEQANRMMSRACREPWTL